MTSQSPLPLKKTANIGNKPGARSRVNSRNRSTAGMNRTTKMPSLMNFLTTLKAQRPFPRKKTTFILTVRRLFLRRTGSSFSRDLC